MMSTQNKFLSASREMRKLVLSEGRLRIENQCAFAGVQDARATALVNISVTLTVACLGFFLSISGKPNNGAGQISAAIATVGFTTAAFLALLAVKSKRFHAVGWFPSDFNEDIDRQKTIDIVESEIIKDLDRRLEENRNNLEKRGRLYNFASWVFIFTPVLCLLFSIVYMNILNT